MESNEKENAVYPEQKPKKTLYQNQITNLRRNLQKKKTELAPTRRRISFALKVRATTAKKLTTKQIHKTKTEKNYNFLKNNSQNFTESL